MRFGSLRLLCLVVLVASLSTLAACGGGDSNTTSATQKDEAERVEAETKARNDRVLKEHRERVEPKLTEKEVEAKETAADFYEILEEDTGGANRNTIDSTSFCDLMSDEARSQTIDYAKVSSGIAQEWSCEDAVDLLVLRSKREGTFKGVKGAEVIGISTKGNRATATVKFGNGPATSVALIREDGEWKLAASPSPPKESGE